jgi:hypothetical protein
MNLVIIEKETGREVLDLGVADTFQNSLYGVERNYSELEKTLSYEKEDLMSKVITNTAMSPHSYDDVKKAVEEMKEYVDFYVDSFVSMGKKILLSYILEDERYDFDIR